MSKSSRPAFLRLVSSKSETGQQPLSSGGQMPAQETFLPSSASNTIIFLDWRGVTAEDMADVFELSRPKIIFDLRVAPRFDLSGFNRRSFFSELQKSCCQYVDLLGRMNLTSVGDALANPALVALRAASFTEKLDPPHIGPLVFIHDDDLIDDERIATIAKCLPRGLRGGWQIYRPLQDGKNVSVGEKARSGTNGDTPTVGRNTVFISHATPEDNHFVAWLSSRLIAAGFEVWTDLSMLKGGDPFWSDIESVIRTKAAKVIFIQSKFVSSKRGARKEAYLALKVGEKNSLKRFVIPMRIDDTPFDETLIELIDLQSIDCRGSWLHGLDSLMTVLIRDRVPRNASFKTEQFSDLVRRADHPSLVVRKQSEDVIANILAFKSLPSCLNFFSCTGIQSSDLRDVAAEIGAPAFAYYALLVSTAKAEALSSEIRAIGKSTNVEKRASVSWEDFLHARCGDLPAWKRADARRYAVNLLHQMWSSYLPRRGAKASSLANGKVFWYFEDQFHTNNKIRFKDFAGRSVSRQLVGYSAKRRVYWHFGIQGRAQVSDENVTITVSPHVVFSSNGKDLLPSKSQQHSLRRSFCKSWWNDRWRDLLQGFIAAVSDENGELSFAAGDETPIILSGQFQHFSISVSPSFETTEAHKYTAEDQIEDSWDDELAELNDPWPDNND